MPSKRIFTTLRARSLLEALREEGGLSASEAEAVVRAGAVKVDGRIVGTDLGLRAGAKIVVRVESGDRQATQGAAPPEPRIVYRDDSLCIVDKPAGMLAQRGPGATVSLDQWVIDHLGREARPMHRLDREASGLLLCAITAAARVTIQRALLEGRVDRRYTALVEGRLEGEGRITKSIGVDPLDRRKRRALPERDPNGQPAASRYRALRHHGGSTTVELMLETGRTHQLRVHLASIGHPILGDRLYGAPPASRLMLHAHQLTLSHPREAGGQEIRAHSSADSILA